MTTASPSQSTRSAMSREQIEARAIARAREEHVHILAVPGRAGVYTTRSKSNPAERYTLVASDGIEACTCKGFEYRASCKHVEALRNRLARETAKVSQPVPSAAELRYPSAEF